MFLKYNYKLGITVDGVNIPDPAEWNYQVGDLDTEGGRDATGYLHRAYVTTKINYEFSWNALEREMLMTILNAVNKEKFILVAPDPRTMDKTYTGEYYVGDRSGKAHYYLPEHEENSMYTLKLKFIEY